ncbi:MAG: hypothetical protein HY828_10935 [Actinobacteria bacterium]|nr:hypothetical protein [Actinomycetota bacterium]
MNEEPGGGTRPELPVVLGGRATPGAVPRQVPLRTILGSSSRTRRPRRLTMGWWGSVAWGVAVLACATSAFAIRDTMFPRLGRTEPPSAWQAPTRPPASIPYSDREGPVSTGTSVAPEAAAAAGGTPLGIIATDAVTTTSSPNDDALVSSAAPTASSPWNTTVTSNGSSPVATNHTVSTSPSSTDVSAPTTTDDVVSSTDDTVPDDGGGNQRGRSPGGSTGDTLP